MKKHIDAAKRRMRASDREILFLGAGEDARLIASQGPWKGLARRKDKVVIFLQPFAEEMNRCRRLISLSQSKLNEAGICSATIDYLGTGDSAGRFHEARLSDWIADVHRLCDLCVDAGAKSIDLVGVRFGALLAQIIAAERSDVDKIIAVQPQESFTRAMRQFIRIASATLEPSAPEGAGQVGPSPARQLEAGADILVGGYTLSPDLYGDFKERALPEAVACPITTLFVGLGSKPNTPLSAGENRLMQAFAQRAPDADYMRVNDVQLWHQGVPEEPKELPDIIAQILTGSLAAQELHHAA